MNPHSAAAAATDLGRRPPTTNSIAVNRQFERCGELFSPQFDPTWSQLNRTGSLGQTGVVFLGFGLALVVFV